MIAFYALTADRTNLIGHPIGDPADGTDWLRRRAGIPISPAVGKANTDHVLDVLGLPPTDEHGDAYGDEPADVFLGRVLLAQAIEPADAGTPATVRNVDDGFGGSPILTAGGRWHDMGRAPGYTDRKLAELRTFAEWCAARGHRVAWA
jgi:hypothetical protein